MILVLFLILAGCTIPGQYPDGSVVYFDDSKRPYMYCHSTCSKDGRSCYSDLICEEVK
jgi:hypothetical protein